MVRENPCQTILLPPMSTVPLFLSLAGVHISLSEKEVLTDAPQQQ